MDRSSSKPAPPDQGNGAKKKTRAADELRPEYDFATMKRGIRGKYFGRYQRMVRLRDDAHTESNR